MFNVLQLTWEISMFDVVYIDLICKGVSLYVSHGKLECCMSSIFTSNM